MPLKEVSTDRNWSDFIDVVKEIYRGDEAYVYHLQQDLERILGPENPLRKDGDCKLWIYEEDGRLLGRIASFYDKRKDKGGLGFFECVDNQTVADKLFDVGLDFLAKNGFNQAEAPVNFGERDKYWGLMVEGFKRPSYQENYNPRYYQSLFENYGFEKGIVQTTQELSPEKFNLKRFKPLAERVLSNPEFEVRHMEKNKLPQYAADFVHVYNSAWSRHEHYIPLSVDQVVQMMKSMKAIIREDLVWFTYANEKPVAFYVSVIDVNQIFKKLKGNLNWWGKLKFLYYKRVIKIDRIRGIVFGVVPEYQGRGLTSGMIMKVFEVFGKDPYLKSTELSWVGDFNPKMLSLLMNLGAEQTKVHITYHKKF